MTERLRSINIGGVGGGGGGVGSGYAMIGAPTLISSTFTGATSSPGLTAIGSNAAGSVVGLMGSGSGSAYTNNASGGASGHSNNNNSGSDTEPDLLPVMAQLNFHLMQDLGNAGVDCNSIMNSSQISTASNDSIAMGVTRQPSTSSAKNLTAKKPLSSTSCRFPKLEECAHFHYERVQLGPLSVRLVDDKSELLNSSIASQSLGGDVAASQNSSLRSFSPSICWFIVKVMPNRSDPFLVKRSFDNMKLLDEMLHRCVYDRKISGLKDLSELEFKSEEDVEYAVAKYLERFSKIASDSLTCGTILTWLQLDNKGRRLPLADTDTMKSINTPAVGAAYGVRRYIAQASDEISIEVGDMISVIDMPSAAESIWWRGKKSHLQKSHYEVGFFPQSCVATIGDKVPRHFPLPAPLVGQLDVSPTKPVLRKHGKLIAFFRSFILSRPSRRRLKQSGIYRERVFSCDLSEHLLNSGQEIPMVLKCCAEFIEENGIVDGIYRLSGITSNIQKLRRAFDEERIPDLTNPEIRQDIHAVSSLLKMYFRELPNPLCTYQLYDNFVEAIQAKSESNERLKLMKETVLKLPPPHYRTLKYLATHLNKISQHSARTGMTDKNLAIVWAPNLLRSPALESGGVAALRGVGVQAVVTEYLIRNCHLIFDPSEEGVRLSYAGNAAEQRMDSLTDCESLLVEQREHDQSLCFVERPKSLSASGPKLISLEEAQERHSRLDGCEMNKSMPINMITNSANIGSYIEVGGGPSSLPDKYHTVLPVPRSWQKRKTHSWKSLFTRNPRNSNSNNDMKGLNASLTTTAHKTGTAAQVTFADDQAGGEGLHMKSSKQDKPKSIDLFEVGKPMDICVRSNSIDSLRTAGHSRSVSHDSYFDLLQSPQRGMTTCPSRELSELGLNFDREEPEMRIFSESESLVSSPKVGKENIPPARRVLRARPEEFASTTNSVNPSPKKQPRLNLLSPSSAAAPHSWGPTTSATTPSANSCSSGGGIGDHNDESCCKRYKLEDQLSDIQFIDCSTPEHTISNPNTMYTSVQVHNPPKQSVSKSSLDSEGSGKVANNTTFGSIFEKKDKNGGEYSHIITRYSYPTVQVGAKRKDNDTALKERFSYPGSGNSGKYVCRLVSKDVKMCVQDDSKKSQTSQQQQERQMLPAGNDEYQTQRVTFSQQQQHAQNKLIPDLLKPKNRYSYCDPLQDSNTSINFLLRSSSADLSKDKLLIGSSNEMERSKLSVTPSSPIQSPRYSLLVGETSSENSSAVNTPLYELDPIAMMAASQSSHIYDETKEFNVGNCCRTSMDSSICSNLTSQNDKRDIKALKRELSLDLDPANMCSKMSVDLTDSTRQPQSSHLIPSPNTHTSDNTSQSVTPSEFGYQHLNRQSNVVSLESSPNFDDYENIDRAFLNYDKSAVTPSNSTAPLMGQSPTNSAKRLVPVSPIKATINITYNLKSPREGPLMPEPEAARKPLLETSFDENIVYEQVKFFRNSVTEVNQLLNNGNPIYDGNKDALEEEDAEVIAERSTSPLIEVNSNLIVLSDEEGNQDTPHVFEDFQMSDHIDSLEYGASLSLYENVELRKPPTVYENIDGESMKSGNGLEKLQLDRRSDSPDPRRSPSNFSVKQLATKFEVSPVEQHQAFDFNVRASKKPEVPPHKPHPPQPPKKPSQNTCNSKQQLNKTNQITRSLDENAFVREFGPKRLEDIARSVHQMDKIDAANRRKSYDFTRPKCLNPPKRLPGLPISEEVCQKNSNNSNSFKLELNEIESSSSSETEANVKITPTTENRISLIQNNFAVEDPNNPGNIATPLKVLSGVKLDRERIDKIKEERRHQLKEKYRADSFKSKSKTELREFQKDDDKFHSESLKVKSKSRGDVRSTFFLKDNDDNLKDCEKTFSVTSGRVRSISDERNQNNCEPESFVNLEKTNTDGVEGSARATVQKFERKTLNYTREHDANNLGGSADGDIRSGCANAATNVAMNSRNSLNSTREKISPKFSIRDVTAMFESRSQNQQ